MNLYSILRNSDNVLTDPGEILLQRNNMIVNVPDESILYTNFYNFFLGSRALHLGHDDKIFNYLANNS